MTKERIENIRQLLTPFVKKAEEFEKDLNKALDSVNKALEQTTSDDCVSREKVWYMITGGKYANEDYEQFIDRLVKELENMPPATPTQGWIPTSERLPEDRNLVLVTAYWHETYQVMMASYFGEGLWWCVPFNNCGDHMQKLNPKAWRPLPKPYEGGTKC